MGRENRMVIGIAATYIELEVKAAALDVQDRRRRIEHQSASLISTHWQLVIRTKHISAT
jgi:hypothetical protein